MSLSIDALFKLTWVVKSLIAMAKALKLACKVSFDKRSDCLKLTGSSFFIGFILLNLLKFGYKQPRNNHSGKYYKLLWSFKAEFKKTISKRGKLSLDNDTL